MGDNAIGEAEVRERLGQEYGEFVTPRQAEAAVEAVGQIMISEDIGAAAAVNEFIRRNPRRS